MSTRRYEILLRTRYNDGTLVEPEKLFQTQEELVAQFGALTTSPERVQGVWMHEGHRFEDQHLRLLVDVESNPMPKTVLFSESSKTDSKLAFARWIFGSFPTRFKLCDWSPVSAPRWSGRW